MLDPAQAAVQDVLARFQASLDRHPEVPQAQGDALVVWLKTLLSAKADDATGGRAGLDRSATRSAQGDSPAQRLEAVLSGRPGPAPAVPDTWEAWIRTAVKTLGDPSASPREAPFHAAQAKDGTAFFEIPLPWAPQAPLQMWVESDQAGARGGPEDTKRVLLGLSFSNLGETRLGLAQGPGGLQVRVWTEHPALLEPAKDRMVSELRDLGAPVDLKILPLPAGPVASVKSLVTGATLQILG